MVDARDTQAFTGAFAADGVFRFGNAPALTGPQAIAEVVGGFFSAIGGVQHEVQEIWETSTATICRGQVNYTRLDGGELSVPFAVILKGSDGAISEYLIYVDNSALFSE